MNERLTQLDFVCCNALTYPVGILADQVITAHAITTHERQKHPLSLETLIGLPESNQPYQQQLTLTIGTQYTADIGVNSTISLQTLTVNNIHPLPPLLAARCQLHGVKALALSEKVLRLLIDTDCFLPKSS
jgi:hypothetical protein